MLSVQNRQLKSVKLIVHIVVFLIAGLLGTKLILNVVINPSKTTISRAAFIMLVALYMIITNKKFRQSIDKKLEFHRKEHTL